MTSYSRFLVKLLLFSAIVAVGVYFWEQFGPAAFRTPMIWFSLGFFVMLTALLHFILVTTSKGDPKKFIRSYMLVTVLKLFASLLVVVIFMLADRAGAKAFAITFMLLYFIYTGFEVFTLLRRPNS